MGKRLGKQEGYLLQSSEGSVGLETVREIACTDIPNVIRSKAAGYNNALTLAIQESREGSVGLQSGCQQAGSSIANAARRETVSVSNVRLDERLQHQQMMCC